MPETERKTDTDVNGTGAKSNGSIAEIRESIDATDAHILGLLDRRAAYPADLKYWESPPRRVRDDILELSENTLGSRLWSCDLFAVNPEHYPKILGALCEPGDVTDGLRDSVLRIDLPLIVYSAARLEYAYPIWEYKKSNNLPVGDVKREIAMVDSRIDLAKEFGYSLAPETIRNVFMVYTEMSRELQQILAQRDGFANNNHQCPRCGYQLGK